MDCIGIGRSAGLTEVKGPRYLYRRRSICDCLPAHARSVLEERGSGTVFLEAFRKQCFRVWVRQRTAIRDAMNIADGRLLKTGSALFKACQMFSSRSTQEVVTQKKIHVVFTDYQHTACPCHVDEQHLR
jgi:hypothetical protein